MNISLFMEQGISEAVGTAARFYLGSSAGRRFIGALLPAFAGSARIRARYEEEGIHVPPYLIASIASACNLRCAGCYARAGGVCTTNASDSDMDGEQWTRIFGEASQLGVSLILLAGGEPLLRRDVIEAASGFENIVFPIFTNGTMIDDAYLQMFDKCRNLVPVLSIEGSGEETNKRRGKGVWEQIEAVAVRLKERKMLFGVSITVTTHNLHAVTDKSFLKDLRRDGCGLVFFVEYVPAEQGTEELVLSEAQCADLNERVIELRRQYKNMIVVSFPGDEAEMGGCLAAGRGFFHINSAGGAEPCPFSPFSKYNLKDTSMLEVLQSDYFKRLRALEMSVEEHKGGCTLFDLKDEVEKLVSE